ncbi:CotH kinase family protein [uncultured Croceitalea sp.]|uniref:CotH kinase family protein n=1 Tax=uncultured Croceitalea sp. TaxID=1798908 RepID=UPI00330666C3
MIILSKKAQIKTLGLWVFLFLILSCNSDNTVGATDDEVGEEEQENPISLEDRLPQVFVDTKGGTIVDEPKISSDAVLVIAGDTIYNGNLGIEFRGATSQLLFPKKSYGLETWDENDEDINVSLFGLPEEEDWILYGPYSDKSLMRNILIYDLSRDIGQYASRSLFVDLTINEVYQGVYVFMEKLKRDGERIAINKLKDDENSGEDLTGGYILKIDKTAGNNLGEGYNDLNSFVSAYDPPNASAEQKTYFLYEYPDAEDITIEQKAYISTYMADFENALASDDFLDADLGYANFIETESFIDFFLLNELANNVDGYRLSTFMSKDKNEKLKMGPIWDFNLAFGNADYCGGGSTNVWAYKFNDRCPDDFWLVPFWWERLLQDPTFVAQLKERWIILRGNALSNAAIMSRIDAYLLQLNESGSKTQNFETWPVIGTYVWPNNFVGAAYEEELAYLTNWIENRLTWLDSEINQL